MKKNLDITKTCYSEQNFASPLALRYTEVPLHRNVNKLNNKSVVSMTSKVHCFACQSLVTFSDVLAVQDTGKLPTLNILAAF